MKNTSKYIFITYFLALLFYGKTIYAKTSSENTSISGTGSNQNSTYVHPYGKKNGKYVRGHQKTNPNKTQKDNFEAKGNYNPYSGKIGNGKSKHKKGKLK